MGFLAFPTFPQYDTLYALLWGREIADGHAPGFDTYRAPTQHPLLLPVGLVLGPLGEAGARAAVALTLGAMLALLAAVWRMGALAAGTLAAVAAAALIASRLNLWLLSAIGFLDVPYVALVAWAAVLEAERPRRGGAVWALLTLAGLLRPEGWVLLGAYAVWWGWPRRMPVAVAYAAVAPAVWAAVDLVVTGDPLFSLHHTDALALDLQRERPLADVPWLTVELLAEVLKAPVLALSVVGVGLAAALRCRALALPGVLAVLTILTYAVIATGGLPGVYRYLLAAAVGLAVFAAFALTGWTTLPPADARRVPWAVAAAVLLVAGTTYVAAHTHPDSVRAELRERRQIRDDLRALLRDPAVVRARGCGPITVPNHKLIPEVRWLADLPDGAVRARSDPSLGRVDGGVAIVIDRRIERRPALNVGEVPRDGGWQVLQVPPPGFSLAAGNRRFAAYVRC